MGSEVDFNRHVYFHVFHVRIKCLGAHVSRMLNLSPCQLGPQSRNWIPELPENLECSWSDCGVRMCNLSKTVNNLDLIFNYASVTFFIVFSMGLNMLWLTPYYYYTIHSNNILSPHLMLHVTLCSAPFHICVSFYCIHHISGVISKQ